MLGAYSIILEMDLWFDQNEGACLRGGFRFLLFNHATVKCGRTHHSLSSHHAHGMPLLLCGGAAFAFSLFTFHVSTQQN